MSNNGSNMKEESLIENALKRKRDEEEAASTLALAVSNAFDDEDEEDGDNDNDGEDDEEDLDGEMTDDSDSPAASDASTKKVALGGPHDTTPSASSAKTTAEIRIPKPNEGFADPDDDEAERDPFAMYKCPMCIKSFRLKRSYEAHVRSHKTGERFKCDVCDRTFREESGLHGHLRIHSTSKPFKCPHCEKSFCLKSSLDAHLPLHTGAKPFECNVCGKRFKYKRSLPKHMRSHAEGDNPIPIKVSTCEMCGNSFRTKKDLAKHQTKCTASGKLLTALTAAAYEAQKPNGQGQLHAVGVNIHAATMVPTTSPTAATSRIAPRQVQVVGRALQAAAVHPHAASQAKPMMHHPLMQMPPYNFMPSPSPSSDAYGAVSGSSSMTAVSASVNGVKQEMAPMQQQFRHPGMPQFGHPMMPMMQPPQHPGMPPSYYAPHMGGYYMVPLQNMAQYGHPQLPGFNQQGATPPQPQPPGQFEQ